MIAEISTDELLEQVAADRTKRADEFGAVLTEAAKKFRCALVVRCSFDEEGRHRAQIVVVPQ